MINKSLYYLTLKGVYNSNPYIVLPPMNQKTFFKLKKANVQRLTGKFFSAFSQKQGSIIRIGDSVFRNILSTSVSIEDVITDKNFSGVSNTALSVTRDFLVYNSFFDSCHGTTSSGGISFVSTSEAVCRISSCSFNNCSSLSLGGALQLSGLSASVAIYTTTFTNNSAVSGSCIFSAVNTMIVASSLFSSPVSGSILFMNNTFGRVESCVFTDYDESIPVVEFSSSTEFDSCCFASNIKVETKQQSVTLDLKDCVINGQTTSDTYSTGTLISTSPGDLSCNYGLESLTPTPMISFNIKDTFWIVIMVFVIFIVVVSIAGVFCSKYISSKEELRLLSERDTNNTLLLDESVQENEAKRD